MANSSGAYTATTEAISTYRHIMSRKPTIIALTVEVWKAYIKPNTPVNRKAGTIVRLRPIRSISREPIRQPTGAPSIITVEVSSELDRLIPRLTRIVGTQEVKA